MKNHTVPADLTPAPLDERGEQVSSWADSDLGAAASCLAPAGQRFTVSRVSPRFARNPLGAFAAPLVDRRLAACGRLSTWNRCPLLIGFEATGNYHRPLA
jgi:hypothetical protein